MLRIFYSVAFIRKFSNIVSLKDKKLTRPFQFSTQELKYLLWTAFDIQHLTNKGQPPQDVSKKSVTFLTSDSDFSLYSAIYKAADILKINLQVIPNTAWEKPLFSKDSGKILSGQADLLCYSSKTCFKKKEWADTVSIPVMGLKSCSFQTLRTLAGLMVMQTEFGKLMNIRLSWIGFPKPLLSSYLFTVPQLGIRFRYYTGEHTLMSPKFLLKARNMFVENGTELIETTSLEELKHETDVYLISSDIPKCISISDIISVCQTCKFDVDLPRSRQLDVYGSNSLFMKTNENMKWVASAVMLTFLVNYKPTIQEPSF